MSGTNVADVVDIDLGLDDQRILLRNNIEDLVAAADHPADREDAQTNDLPGIGRADFHPPEHGLSIHQPWDDFEQLGLGIAQILGDFGHAVIVELRHLLHLLGDRLPRPGDIGRRIGGLAFQSAPDRSSCRYRGRAIKPCLTSGAMLSISCCTDMSCAR